MIASAKKFHPHLRVIKFVEIKCFFEKQRSHRELSQLNIHTICDIRREYARNSLKIVYRRDYVLFTAQQQICQISLVYSLHAWGCWGTRVGSLSSADATSMSARAAREIADKLWHNFSNSRKSVDTRDRWSPFEVSNNFFLSGESYLYLDE